MTPQEISDHPSPEEFVPRWIIEGKSLQSIIQRLDELEYPEKKISRIVDSIVTTAIILKKDPSAGSGLKKEAKKKIISGICITVMALIIAICLFAFAIFQSGPFYYGIPVAIAISGITMSLRGRSLIKKVKHGYLLAEECSIETLETYISLLESAELSHS